MFRVCRDVPEDMFWFMLPKVHIPVVNGKLSGKVCQMCRSAIKIDKEEGSRTPI